MSWSRRVADPDEARAALADPGDALDLWATGPVDAAWTGLGFVELVPGELVRPVRVRLDGVERTRALGRRLAGHLRAGDLVVLSGPLGAGKTALAQGIGAGLGVQGAVSSPTFVLARVHRGALPLVHVDAYRLREAAGPGGAVDLDDLELDDALSTSVTVVEWGEGVVEQLSPSRLEVALERTVGGPDVPGRDLRHATVHVSGPRWSGVRRTG